MKHKLLIVDDDEAIRTQMKWAFAKDFEIVLAEDASAALRLFRTERPSVTFLDLGLPPHPNTPEEGLATLAAILTEDPNAKVIVVSGQGEKVNAINAVGLGAYDFLCKPIELDDLRLILRRCISMVELEREYQEMQRSVRPDVFEDMLGASSQMQGVFAYIRKVAATTAPVLLLGESGTGKEMAAAALHRRSARSNGPFVAINCNAIPENLLESELFGHEKGAFTGAHMQRKGHIESAAGGTLFLDEIGDLPSSVQIKLLRFLQEQTFQRVGGRHELHADARIVAATHADLKQAITQGKFREDLYFRLAVVIIKLPPLRDRGEDVNHVAREFLSRYAAQGERKNLSFAPDAIRALNSHAWPGNVRELQNRIKRAVIMAEGKRITAADLELDDLSSVVAPTSLKEAREQAEREVISQALKRHRGRITAAAEDLGISRPTLYELMEKLGLERQESGRSAIEKGTTVTAPPA